jgi:hypothetical protein
MLFLKEAGEVRTLALAARAHEKSIYTVPAPQPWKALSN